LATVLPNVNADGPQTALEDSQSSNEGRQKIEKIVSSQEGGRQTRGKESGKTLSQFGR
jgi:hypothetical protein